MLTKPKTVRHILRLWYEGGHWSLLRFDTISQLKKAGWLTDDEGRSFYKEDFTDADSQQLNEIILAMNGRYRGRAKIKNVALS